MQVHGDKARRMGLFIKQASPALTPPSVKLNLKLRERQRRLQCRAHLADLNRVSEKLLEIDFVLVPGQILLQASGRKELHDEFNPTPS